MNTEGSTDANAPAAQDLFTDLLILSDGAILAHNLTPAIAGLLRALNPLDDAMQHRVRRSADISVREMADQELADKNLRAPSSVSRL
jgi:hypothetical protein